MPKIVGKDGWSFYKEFFFLGEDLIIEHLSKQLSRNWFQNSAYDRRKILGESRIAETRCLRKG